MWSSVTQAMAETMTIKMYNSWTVHELGARNISVHKKEQRCESTPSDSYFFGECIAMNHQRQALSYALTAPHCQPPHWGLHSQ